jgi:adenylosuccinate synthase
MSTTCVLGAQWGDEGKARVVDLLADDADLIVRYQGGSNAGHTVVHAGETYRLHLIPSGILRPGKTNVVAHGVVVDPEMLLSEITELRSRGVEVGRNLVVSDRAHLVMPWHKRLDAAREKSDGAKAHGTTGKGIGPCYADKVSYRGIRVGDLYDEAWFGERLRVNLDEKNKILTQIYGEAPLRYEQVHDDYRRYAEALRPFVGDAVTLLHDAIAKGRNVLFEGAQGVMLDVDHGTYPYVTSSQTVAGQAASGSGLGPGAVGYVLGITKAYTTRVGAGPFPTELTDETGRLLGERGHEFGVVTGRKRRCGWFDAVMVRQAIIMSGINGIALTKLDVLDPVDPILVCTGYEIRGRQYDHLPPLAALQAEAKPIYEELEGWGENTRGARSFADLPAKAIKYIRRIEELIEAPAALISTSPERNDTILVKDPFAD